MIDRGELKLDPARLRQLFDLSSGVYATRGGGFDVDPYPIFNAYREKGAVHEGIPGPMIGFHGDALFQGLPYPDRRHFTAFDFETCDELMKCVEQHLAHRRTAEGGLRDLHVDFTGLDCIDSMGLSTLLMIRRRTDAAGVRLHLDERPSGLERLLEITGTLDHLTAPCESGKGERRPGTG